MLHYAKGIAQLRSGNSKRRTRTQGFHQRLKQIPSDRRFFNNDAHAILAVGEKMLEGELEYHKGNYEIAFAPCGKACAGMTTLNISSRGPGCTRRGMGWAALLMEQGHFGEAEQTTATISA